MPFDIRDKIALVTGAGRGIGAAIVGEFLTQHGVSKVYAAVRNLTSANDLVKQHGSDRVIPIFMDLSKPESIKEAVKQTQDVEVVVSNAGVLELANPLDPSFLSKLEYQMEINVYGLVHMAQQYAPVLQRNGGGCFVQINSTASLRCPKSEFAAYSTSKHAAYAVTQALRQTLLPAGTLVLSVHPGPIATDMADQIGLKHVAEPASQVADAIVNAMKRDEFLVYTDTLSKQIGAAYESYADQVIEPYTSNKV